MTNRAQFTDYEYKLTSDFSLALAERWFGEEAVAALPKYVKGKHAGKPKGFITWRKIVRGGWVSERGYMCEPGGYVENRVGKSTGSRLTGAFASTSPTVPLFVPVTLSNPYQIRLDNL